MKKRDGKKIGRFHIYFLKRMGKTNTMWKLVINKFFNDGNTYLTKISQ